MQQTMANTNSRSRLRRRLFSVAAVALAAMLLLAGTFAWSSYANKQNEFFGTGTKPVTPGVELRDDFDPSSGNKDVYVENTGEVPFYVRVKLSEYMELLNKATGKYESVQNPLYAALENPTPGAEPKRLVDAAQWTLHTAETNAADCGEVFHTYWQWVMGGSKDTTLTNGTAYTTPTAAVMTMKDWIAAGSPKGDIWVLDSDGYFYYAQQVAPETTTGLLLDAVNKIAAIDQDYYYAINVEMEVVTEDDLNAWLNGTVPTDGTAPAAQATSEAAKLLKNLSEAYTKITDDMRAAAPNPDDFDKDADGYLNQAENADYQKAKQEQPTEPSKPAEPTLPAVPTASTEPTEPKPLTPKEITANGFVAVVFADADGTVQRSFHDNLTADAKYALITTATHTDARATFANTQAEIDKWWNGTQAGDNCPVAVKLAAVVPHFADASVEMNNHSTPTAVTAVASGQSNGIAFALSAKEAYSWASTNVGVNETRKTGQPWWTRSLYSPDDIGWTIDANGILGYKSSSEVMAVRPALWVMLDALG